MVIELRRTTGCRDRDIFAFWGILGVKNGRSNLENNRNNKNVFFLTCNDISQLFKASAKKFKKKGLIVHTLLKVSDSEINYERLK